MIQLRAPVLQRATPTANTDDSDGSDYTEKGPVFICVRLNLSNQSVLRLLLELGRYLNGGQLDRRREA